MTTFANLNSPISFIYYFDEEKMYVGVESFILISYLHIIANHINNKRNLNRERIERSHDENL